MKINEFKKNIVNVILDACLSKLFTAIQISIYTYFNQNLSLICGLTWNIWSKIITQTFVPLDICRPLNMHNHQNLPRSFTMILVRNGTLHGALLGKSLLISTSCSAFLQKFSSRSYFMLDVSPNCLSPNIRA